MLIDLASRSSQETLQITSAPFLKRQAQYYVLLFPRTTIIYLPFFLQLNFVLLAQGLSSLFVLGQHHFFYYE